MPEDSGEHPAVSPGDANASLWSVSEAMSKLPEEQRLAVALVLVEGMSYKEAAAVLEIPIGTLTSRLARGRTALAAALGRDGVNYDDETLMAYADGELDAALRAEIAAADRTRSGAGATRRAASRAACRGGRRVRAVLDQPVARTAAGRGQWPGARQRGNVVQFPARSTRVAGAAVAARASGCAMAASLVLGVLLSWRSSRLRSRR